MGEGGFKLGRPFLGKYMKMGQSRTRDGWGVQKGLQKRDVFYGCSLIRFFFSYKFSNGMTLMPSQPERDEPTGAVCYSQRRSMPEIKPNQIQIHSQMKRNSYQGEESNVNVSLCILLILKWGRTFINLKIVVMFDRIIHTDALDCYGPPKMLILVFIKFRENQEY